MFEPPETVTTPSMRELLPRVTIRDTDDYALIAVALDDAKEKSRREAESSARRLAGEYGPVYEPEEAVETLFFWTERYCKLYNLRENLSV